MHKQRRSPHSIRVHLIDKSAFLLFLHLDTLPIFDFFHPCVCMKMCVCSLDAKKEPGHKLQFQWTFFLPFLQNRLRVY